jgi:hypothetical protein
LALAFYYDNLHLDWDYRLIVIPYVDMLYGGVFSHYIDFVLDNGDIEWVSATKQLKPTDSIIYASRRAEESNIIYRSLTQDELNFCLKFRERLNGQRFQYKDLVRNSVK